MNLQSVVSFCMLIIGVICMIFANWDNNKKEKRIAYLYIGMILMLLSCFLFAFIIPTPHNQG